MTAYKKLSSKMIVSVCTHLKFFICGIWVYFFNIFILFFYFLFVRLNLKIDFIDLNNFYKNLGSKDPNKTHCVTISKTQSLELLVKTLKLTISAAL